MKRFLVLIFCSVVTCFPVVAQLQFSVGAKVGYSSAGLNRSVSSKKSVDGPLVGVVANFSFTSLFSVQLEPGLVSKGGGYGFVYQKEKYFDYFKFRTLEVPLLAKFTIGESRAKFIGFVGPYFGYTLGIERNFSDPSTGESEKTKYTNFDAADENGIKPNRFDAGLIFGLGLSVDIGKGRLFMDGRFSPGFGKWFEINPVDYQNLGLKDLSHRVVSINLGYILPVWIKN